MAQSKDDLKVVDAFKGAAKTFLGLETDFLGALFSRPSVKAAARKMCPFMLDPSASDAHSDVESIVQNLFRLEGLSGGTSKAAVNEPEDAGSLSEKTEAQAEQEVFGFNDNVSHSGTVFHVQTEAQGGGDPFIETVIYQGGRIFFSKRTRWKDAGEGAAGMGFREFATRQHKAAIAAVKMNRITIQG